MKHWKFFRTLILIFLPSIILVMNGCQQRDVISGNDFFIDLTTGNVTDRNGMYQTSVPDYANLYLTGGEVYVFGIIVFKGIDQQFYALSQYHTDGCTVAYQVGYDELVCPCDQYHFDKYGQETFGNGSSYLTVYATSYSNNLLHVYTP
ncbi:MAG: hypothetical protein LH473_09090 [Chitinophagales bacterium]|nr:hypothetical protein [Chitinophagales bacterium]